MTSNNDPLGKALNLAPIQSDSVKSIVAKAHDDSAKNDFQLARSNIHEVIQNGTFAMEKLSQIADSSQHPRAFEVLSKLMDTMLQANKDLLDIQKKIRDIELADKPVSEAARPINNNLFVGSTAELQNLIDTMREKDE